MNTVEILIAKWDAATRELSALEDGIYWRLVRWCYGNESLVPLDTMSQYRVAGAHTDDEHRAVDKVLEQFFERTPTGYQQKYTWRVIKSWKEGEHEREAASAASAARREASRLRMREMKAALKEAGHAVTGNLPNEMLLSLCEVYEVPVQAHWRTLSSAERFAGQHQGLPSAAHMPQGMPQASIPLTRIEPSEAPCGSVVSLCGTSAAGAASAAQGSPSAAYVPQDGAAGPPVRAPDTVIPNTNTLTLFEGEPRAHVYAGGAAGALTREEPCEVQATPTRRGMAGMALKRGGLTEFNLAHPKLLALLDAGVEDEELRLTAAEATARGKGFGYVMAMIEGRRRDAAAAGAIPGRTPSLIEQLAPGISAHRSPTKRSG